MWSRARTVNGLTAKKTLYGRVRSLLKYGKWSLGAKKDPEAIKEIGATLTQQKNSAPANAVTDTGSYTSSYTS